MTKTYQEIHYPKDGLKTKNWAVLERWIQIPHLNAAEMLCVVI